MLYTVKNGEDFINSFFVGTDTVTMKKGEEREINMSTQDALDAKTSGQKRGLSITMIPVEEIQARKLKELQKKLIKVEPEENPFDNYILNDRESESLSKSEPIPEPEIFVEIGEQIEINPPLIPEIPRVEGIEEEPEIKKESQSKNNKPLSKVINKIIPKKPAVKGKTVKKTENKK